MGNANLTEQLESVWPARFGEWAERAPESRTLCRTAREAPWRLRPPTVADVREVVREAARSRTPLWPVSRGCNWGYGSHLPARDGSVILDLSSLDAIGDLDRPSLSVRIEPGVTQAALRDFLKANAPDLALNVTGSGAATSVLGNALERGIGYSGEKDRELYALEVLLPDGTMLAPAAGRHHRTRTHPAGLSTDALFFQSNLGVVVGARLRLRIRQEAEDAVVVQGEFAPVIAALKRGYDDNLLVNPTHVAEPGRAQRLGFNLLKAHWGRVPTPAEVAKCFPEQNSYNALVPLYGRRRVVDAAWAELKRAAPAGVKLTRASAGKLDSAARWLGRLGAKSKAARLMAMRPIVALIWGEPSNAGLASLDGFKGGDPDLAARGAIYGNAVSAVDSADAGRISGIVRGEWKDSAFTWIILDSRCMLTIYTLHFDDAESAAARGADAAIVGALRAAGFPQYRLGVNTPGAPGAGDILRRLKSGFDPLGIVAPGHYET
jgi:4-cresol dehydrogenase (hydroxylating) flavoprotein subunit